MSGLGSVSVVMTLIFDDASDVLIYRNPTKGRRWDLDVDLYTWLNGKISESSK